MFISGRFVSRTPAPLISPNPIPSRTPHLQQVEQAGVKGLKRVERFALPRTATHRNTLQHTVYTATHCNTP